MKEQMPDLGLPNQPSLAWHLSTTRGLRLWQGPGQMEQTQPASERGLRLGALLRAPLPVGGHEQRRV